MIKKKPMFLFYFSITLAICSSALYHFTAKSTSANVNFTVSLLVTYAAAFIVVLFTFVFFPLKNGLAFELKQLNWAPSGLPLQSLELNLDSCSPIERVGIWVLPLCWSM